MTLETLAAAIQQDFLAIRREMGNMATKGDIRQIRDELAEGLADVRDKIATTKEELRDQIAGLRYAKGIDELRGRVKVIEGRLDYR